jgi:hypothetical protein
MWAYIYQVLEGFQFILIQNLLSRKNLLKSFIKTILLNTLGGKISFWTYFSGFETAKKLTTMQRDFVAIVLSRGDSHFSNRRDTRCPRICIDSFFGAMLGVAEEKQLLTIQANSRIQSVSKWRTSINTAEGKQSKKYPVIQKALPF